jgi:hypothetical protein
VQDIHIPLSTNRQWDPHTEKIAFAFPAGTEVLIPAIVWTTWTPLEKMTELWRSFWTTDTYRSYSINFVWGPVLTSNPIARRDIYEYLPPRGISATRYLYPLLGIAIVIGIALLFLTPDRTKGKKRMLRCIVGSFAAAWLLFDLRMGVEMFGYVVNDWQRYVTKPVAEQTFRTHGTFYSIAQQSLPTLMQQPAYGFLAKDGTPFYSNLRYMTYPSLPKTEDMDQTGLTTWLVIDRPDVAVNSRGQLTVKGAPKTSSGTILQRFDDHSFLFRTP